jgi:hypothetical protein
MTTPDRTGHTNIKWDPAKPDEVAIARAAFDAAIANNRAQAFTTPDGETQGVRMTAFDPYAARILVVPHLRGG